jgi:histidyl-tRNA synthetase
VTLRPEATAGIARAVISNGLVQQAPLKFFYSGPMFRYERPQKGRFRQFHQIDVEILGVASPQADIEVIACGQHILDDLGLEGRTMLELNTLGDPESRKAYREALVGFYSKHLDALSEDSRKRLERNPLRILDSKDEGDKRINADAPSNADYLTPAAREFFDNVRRGLDALGIGYQVNPRLVRGLDYYVHTTFEFITQDLGSQGTVMGGGRYDGLVELLGGPAMPGVGWAAGIERLAMLIEEPSETRRPVAIVPVGEAAEVPALKLAQELRRAGFVVEMGYSGNLKRRMQRADKLRARIAILLGENELAKGVAALRDLDRETQEEVPLDKVKERLAALG